MDLKAQYELIKEELDQAIHSVIDETAFVRGPYVHDFEREYEVKYGVKHCISCANGTDALYIALKMLGVGPGDEVITTACSWISTSEVISQAGAQVVFVDIDPKTFLIDLNKVEKKITQKTKAIIPVHLYGQCVDMPKLMKLAKKYELKVIEDCAQAHFSEFNGKKAGTFGDVGTFSFYPGKNLGAWGDAGCMVTNDEDLSEKLRMFANHGSLVKHQHIIEGINSRLDGLQASILSVKLNHILTWTKERQEVARKYNMILSGVPQVVTPYRQKGSGHVYHVYCLKVQRRDELESFLNKHGIATARHYPTPLPFLEAYSYMGHKVEDFSSASQTQSEILSLPIYPELSDEQIEFIGAVVKKFY